MNELECLSSYRRGWILCETKFEVTHLKYALEKNPPPNDLVVLTIRDAISFCVREVLKQESPHLQIPRELSFKESLSLIQTLLFANKNEFELLHKSTLHGKKVEGASPYPVPSLRTLFDSLRLNQSEERFLGSMIDHFGNTKEEKKKAEETLFLLNQYEEFQREHRTFDQVMLIEMLIEIISQLPQREILVELLPEAILFYRPTHLFPLEEILWSSLGKILEIHVAIYEQEISDKKDASTNVSPLSKQYLSSLQQYFKQEEKKFNTVQRIAPKNPSREKLVRSLIDYDTEPVEFGNDPHGVSVWRCEERRDEVRRVICSIAGAISQGKARAEDFHIIALELDSYHDLILSACHEAELEVYLPKGRPLHTTRPASVFRAYLAWLKNPTIDTGRSFFSDPLVKNISGSKECFEAFKENYPDILLEISQLLPGSLESIDETVFDTHLKMDLLADFYFRHGLNPNIENSKRWALPAFQCWLRKAKGFEGNSSKGQVNAFYQELFAFILQLSILHREFEIAWQFHQGEQTSSQRLTHIKNNFFAATKKLSDFRLRGQTLKSHLEELIFGALSFRELKKLIKTVSTYLEFKGALVGEASLPVGEIITALEDELETRSVQPFTNPSAINVTELLDSRSFQRKYAFVLGATSDCFPKRELSKQAFGSELDYLSARITEAYGGKKKSQEAYWLLSHLLLNSEELILTYPLHTEVGEALPAGVVTLLDLIQENKGESIFDQSKYLLSSFKQIDTLTSLHPSKGRTLLESRYSDFLTAYDGFFGESNWAANNTRYQVRGVNEYSTTALETLSDCPHRFFFRDLLAISTRPRSLLEDVYKNIGEIVHRSLFQFYSQQKKPLYQVDDSTLYNASCLLKEIAEEQFSKSEINWEAHPLFRNLRRKVLLGLDEKGDRGRRGYLKAALVFQRDLISTMPTLLEFSFGRNAAEMEGLSLQGGDQDIIISGKIDRLDGVRKEDGEIEVQAVWDYKTGQAPSISDIDNGRSLQIPLYAAFIKDRIPPYQLPIRGGVIALHKPNRRDEEVSSPRYGVLVEHLSLPKRGEALDSALALERDGQVREKTLSLDRLVREGRLHQKIETKGCPVCDYRPICGRNEALLRVKLKTEKPERRLKKKEQPKETHLSFPTLLSSSPEQLQAADVSKSMVVVAGAGSGKTFVLRNRILKLLLQGEPLSSIVAITFTEKAALEIKSRLELAIWSVLREKQFEGETLLPQALSALHEAKSTLQEAQIGTIHSFCTTVIGMDPELSPYPFLGDVLSQGEQEELLSQVVNDLFLDLKNQKQIDEILVSGISYPALFSQIKRFVSSSQLLKKLSASYYDPSALLSKISQLKDVWRKDTHGMVCQWLTPWCNALCSWLDEEYARTKLNDTERAHFVELLQTVQAFLAVEDGDWVSSLYEVKNITEKYYSSAKIRSKNNPRNYFKELRDFLEEISFSALSPSLDREEEGVRLSKQILSLSRSAYENYQQRKAVQGVVDFNDLVDGAYEMLVVPKSGYLETRREELLLRLQKTFKHLLIDEFQDTDIYQWGMLRRIVGTLKSKDARSVFVVGDEKQAIYGFRGGDVRVFQEAMEEIKTVGEVQFLNDNYRALSQLVSFANSFFKKLFLVDFNDDTPRVSTAVKPQAMNAIRTPLTKDVGNVRMLFVSDDDQEDSHEAMQIGMFISGVLGDLEGKNGGEREYPLLTTETNSPTIAVLTRSVRDLLKIAQTLDELGVHFSISHSNGFFELDEIVQFENLFQFLSNEGDRISLIGILRSPLIGLSDRELVDLQEELLGRWEEVESEGEGAIRSVVRESLHRMRQLASGCSSSIFLEILCAELHLREIYEQTGKGEAFKNIERFIDLLRKAELDGDILPGAGELLAWFQEQRKSGHRSPNANLTTHQVVLMTVHGAKGLEFPMVILPFLDGRRHRDYDFMVGEMKCFESEQKEDNYLTLLGVRVENEEESYRREKTFVGELIANSAAAIRSSEERRIFYVACTRARDYLVLSMKEGKRKWANASQENHQDTIFHSDSPAVWLRNILQPDDEEHPTELRLEGAEGETIKIPVIRSY